MLKYISNLLITSNFFIFILIVFVIVSFSVLVTFFSRRVFTEQKLDTANQWIAVANGVSAQAVSILIGFAIYSLFDNFHDAEFAIHQEAKSLKSIYIYSENLSSPAHNLIKEEVKKYAETVINKDWPEMAKGEIISDASEKIIQKMRIILYHHPVTNRFQSKMVDNILDEIKNLCEDRDDRIDLSTKGLRKEIFIIVWFISLICIFLFSIDGGRLRFHLILSISLSLIIASNLFLMMALDRPFSGALAVQPQPFQEVLKTVSSPS